MEKIQKDFIQKHLSRLIDLTDCNTSLLTKLFSESILSNEDVQRIKSKETPCDKSLMLYETLYRKTGSYKVLLCTLRELLQTGAADLLEKINQPVECSHETDVANKVYAILKQQEDSINKKDEKIEEHTLIDVFSPTRLFTGRVSELDQLHEMLTRGHGSSFTVVSQIISISGLGGIGKTELCRKYIDIYGKDYSFIIWINANKEESIAKSFEKIAKDYFKIPTKDANRDLKDTITIVQDVYQKLAAKVRKTDNCLMVFDNAANSKFLFKFLPSRSFFTPKTIPYVLLTSRECDWPIGTEIMNLNVMILEDAVDLVKTGLSIVNYHVKEEVAIQLVMELQLFPLAIQQAISYICKQRKKSPTYEVEMYSEKFKSSFRKILDSKVSELLSDYEETTMTTWLITVEAIKEDKDVGEMAYEIFQMMAYFEADKIPVKMLLNMQDGDEKELTSAIELLVKYSMISHEADSNFLCVHRLVQKVTQIKLKETSMDETVISSCILLLSRSQIKTENVEHGFSVWQYASYYPTLVKRFSLFPFTLLRVLRQQGKYEECQDFSNLVLTHYEGVLGQGHWNYIQMEIKLAELQHQRGAYSKAIESYKGITMKLDTLEPSDAVISEKLSVEHKIGQVLGLQGRYAEAITLLDRVIEDRERNFESEEVNICEVIHTQVSALILAGKTSQALEKSEKVLACFNTSSGATSKKVLQLVQDIAIIHGEKGNYSKAISMLRKAYKDMKSSFGVEGHYTLRCGHNLALYLTRNGDHEESLLLLREVLEGKKKVEGEDHPTTLLTLETMAETLINLGKFDEALTKFLQVRQFYKELYGEDNPKTLVCDLGLGMSLAGNCKFDEALYVLKDLLPKLQEALGDEHVDVWRTKIQIAEALRNKEDYIGALNFLEGALKKNESIERENETQSLILKAEALCSRVRKILELSSKC